MDRQRSPWRNDEFLCGSVPYLCAGGEDSALMAEGGVLIRKATLEDLDRILAVDAVCFTRPWSEISFRSLIEAEHVVFLVAEVIIDPPESVVVGHGTLIRSVDDADLATLAVAPEERGRGIGGVLLDRLLDAAHGAGVRAVFLEVRPSNEEAVSLYLGRGFRHVGVRRQYYDRPPEDALVLRLRLPPASDSDEDL